MATTSVRTVFLDTNILLRANVAEAPLHAEALAAIRALRARGDVIRCGLHPVFVPDHCPDA